MKKNSLVLMLCAGVAGLAGAAGALRLATKAESFVTLDHNDYYVSSVAIRLTDQKTETGVRFVSQFEKDKFDAANVSEIAFEVLPEIFKDEKIAAVQIPVELTDREEITENEKTYYQFSGYIYDFPANNYGLKLVARGYAKYDDSKEFYTEYSPSYSLTDVAKTADSALQDKVAEYVVENVDITYKNIDGNNSSNCETLTYGATLNYPTVTVPNGYYFAGWYTKKDTKWNTSWTAQGNMTLTAKFIALKGKIVDEKLYSANGIGTSETEETIPDGFEKISMYTTNNANVHGQFFSAVNISAYSEVYFAIKTDGKFVFDVYGSDESHEWLYFTLTQNDDATWNMIVKNGAGTQVYQISNLNAYKSNSPTPYTNYALNAILYGNPVSGYAPTKTGESLNVWFTEVRGTLKPVDIKGTLIDEKLYSANGIGTSETEEAIPEGFEKISMYTTNGANVHGQFFSATDISGYSEVYFAVKTDGKFVLNQEKSDNSGEWLYFTLTQGADQTWTIVVKKADGTEIYNKGGFVGYKSDSPAPYTNYALNAILYGCPAGFHPAKATDEAATLNVWFTEVRGIKKS